MSATWLLPAALAGLIALLLPVLLHLQRRRQQPVAVMFAALRWLAAPQTPRRRWQLREPWLLAVRMLLVACVVLALAQPLLGGVESDTPWHVVAPGVDPDAIDWPEGSDDHQRRWLAPGFPSLDDPPPAPPVPTASLLRTLDVELPDATPLTLYVPARLEGLDGARLALARNVDWRIVSQTSDAPAAPAPPAPRFAVAGSQPPDLRLQYLDAAHAVWHADGAPGSLPRIAHDAAPESGIETLVWLSSEPLPPVLRMWLEKGGRVLAIAPDAGSDDATGVQLWRGRGGASLRAVRVGRGTLRMLDCPLQPACLPELFDPGFPALLRGWLAPAPAAPTSADAAHAAPERVARTAPPPQVPLAPWLALVAGLLCLLERLLANGPRRP